jgi:hypothetical protein
MWRVWRQGKPRLLSAMLDFDLTFDVDNQYYAAEGSLKSKGVLPGMNQGYLSGSEYRVQLTWETN